MAVFESLPFSSLDIVHRGATGVLVCACRYECDVLSFSDVLTGQASGTQLQNLYCPTSYRLHTAGSLAPARQQLFFNP
jgi:hypothetical protein